MSDRRETIVNTLTGWGAVLVRTGLALYIVPFFLQHVGRSGYGIIGLLGVLLALSDVVDLGLRQALARELTEQIARKNRLAYIELLNTAYCMYLMIGLLVSITCIIFAAPIVVFLKVPLELQSETINLVQIYAAGAFILAFVGAIYNAVLISENRFDLRNNVESGSRILTGIAIIVVLSQTGAGLYTWVYLTLAGQFLTVVFQYLAAVKTCPWLRFHWKYIQFSRAKQLIQFGWKVYLLQLTNLISERTDPIVISRFFGPAGVALYNPGSRLSGVLRPIALTMAGQFHTLATRHHIENALGRQQQMLIHGTRYTLTLSILFSVGLFVFAEPFCALWLGNALGSDYKVVVIMVQLWAIIDILICSASMQWPLLLGAKKLGVLNWIQGGAAIINIALSVYFTGYTPLGIWGVLVATIIGALIMRPVLIIYGAKVFKIRVSTFLRQTLLKPLLLIGLLLPVAYCVRYLIDPVGYISLLSCGLLIGIAWIILSFGIVLSQEERHWLLARLTNLFPHFRN
jgi:O-antigen/teichoic acid export membrane protein